MIVSVLFYETTYRDFYFEAPDVSASLQAPRFEFQNKNSGKSRKIKSVNSDRASLKIYLDRSLVVAQKSGRGALVALSAEPRARARRMLVVAGGSCHDAAPHPPHAADNILSSVLKFDLHKRYHLTPLFYLQLLLLAARTDLVLYVVYIYRLKV